MQTSKVRPEPKIPDHEVLRKIGGGAYGEVWLAQGVTGAWRAVKTVWHNDFDDERGFEREFEGILKYEPISRDHPGLVHILHVGRGEAEGEPFYYYVMELGDDVAGGREINTVEYEPRTLRSDMKAAEGRALEVEECISAGRFLAEGLEHLHQHGLAHRDVKPSNVIFVDGKAKLADIGLVALRGQQTFVGTEGFVPPEGPGSAQADVYSLGKVLYEMATGKDRLDFPELPDELPEGAKLKRWRLLNSIICDVCEPKISRRKIKAAGELATELALLEEGRRRPVRVKPGLVAAIVLLGLGVGGVTQIMNLPSITVNSPGPAAPPVPVEMGVVSITSKPDGAEVFSEEGEWLGVTPMAPLTDFPVDSIVKFVLKRKGFADKETGGRVTRDPPLLLSPKLDIYDPPVPGDPWTDVFGVHYKPKDDHHVSQYYVNAESWRRFMEDTKMRGGKIVTLSESGMDHEVVLANRQEAKRYTEWLEEKCTGSFIDLEHWIEFEFDRGRVIPEAGEKPKMWPFYAVVRKEVSAEIYIGSNPPGASIYLNGEKQDKVTTLDGVQVTATWRKGEGVLVILEKDKFKQYDTLLHPAPGEVWEIEQALVPKLEPENIFEAQRENSLGMKFVPLGGEKSLLVSTWETRIQDYEQFVKTMKGKIPSAAGPKDSPGQLYPKFLKLHRKNALSLPPEPSFGWQGPAYPIVNVTRKEAELFCEWLTLYEQKRGEIEKNHEYRLPTDEEWSLLAGYADEGGLWPIERHGKRKGLWWGGDEIPPPPPEGTGNFSDESSFELPEQQIRDYNDGYPFTAPVGKFRPRKLGEHDIFDLEGNVLEWISEDYSAAGQYNVARGASWKTHRDDHLKISSRHQVEKPGENPAQEEPRDIYGFRVVLAKVPVIPEKVPEEEGTDD